MMVRTLIKSVLLIAMLITVMMMARCGNKQETLTMDIPLPEHPRPDFMREEWINLNGSWDFSLDSLDVGEKGGTERTQNSYQDRNSEKAVLG